MNTENNKSKTTSTRRKLLAGISALSLFPLVKLGFLTKKKDVIACAPDQSGQKIKMLTQDGKLVEVDLSKIGGVKQKASKEDLQNWVKKDLQ